MRSIVTLSILGVSLLFAVDNASACSACGCSFNSDWASEGYSSCGKFNFDVRFDYIDQDELRRGSGSVSEDELRGAEEHHDETEVVKHSVSDDGHHADDEMESIEHEDEVETEHDHEVEDGHSDHADEIQHSTITKQTLLSFDYTPEKNWGVRVLAPYINRSHSTYADGGDVLSKSETSGFGDLQIIGRHEGFSSIDGLGVEFGVKVPTGSFDETFDSGPIAGEKLDRGLQPGTGTTDLILGAYKFGRYSESVDYFLHLTAQQAVAKRDDFAPGTAVTASSGVGYKLSEMVRPQIQLNFRHEEREVGSESDSDNSGGDFLYISPGVTVAPTANLRIYGVVQLPAYQRVNGLQLHPEAIYSAGVRFSF